MAQCALSPHEFVQNAFNPVVAVLCSAKAEASCQKNNLSFVEMVQPFCKLNTEAHLRDPMNQSFTIRNLRISLVDMNYEPPKPLVSRKMLYEVIANTAPNLGDRSRQITLKTNEYTLQINNSTPWFEAYRDCFLKIAPTSDHEFTSHFLACVFVASVNDSDPLQEFAKMSQQQQSHQQQNLSKPSKWFFANTLKFYILLQDYSDSDNSRTESLYQNLKSTYGANSCHLLRINSRDFQSESSNFEENHPNLPDPWSQFLTRRIPDADLGETYPSTPSPTEGTEFQKADQNNPIGIDITSEISQTSVPTIVDHPLMPHHHSKSSPQSSVVLTVEGSPLDENTVQINPSAGMHLEATDSIGLTAASLGLSTSTSSTSLASRRSSRCHPFSIHGMCLTMADMDQIRLFVHDFCMRALLPYVEKQMAILHEAVANRKGLHRSFFSATKKWFGSNKPSSSSSGSSTSFIVYGPEAVELQVRRLGDLAFMFQNYELAYQAYHMVKRDFSSDQAWMHFAGALEMAALSIFMLGASSQRQLPFHYFDSSISTYLTTCKVTQFATRVTLLATECLKHQERFLEAASYFIRLTSEESDLRSALLLEQAAHCFANLRNTCIRKYAFYMILAGHRYNKAGQKKHSLRCYKQALQVYQGKQWLLAEDHINLTAGRLNFNLNLFEEAVLSFHQLLYDGSMQNVTQQAYYVREYLAICSHLLGQNGQNESISQLPLPTIDAQRCKVILGDIKKCSGKETDLELDLTTTDGDEEKKWYELEELTILQALGSLPGRHRPTLQCYTESTDNSELPLAVVEETITLQLPVYNSLKIPLTMSAIHLLWRFELADSSDGSPAILTNDMKTCIDQLQNSSATCDVVETDTLSELMLDGMQSVTVNLCLIPQQTGSLTITGIAYNLTMQASQPSSIIMSESPTASTFFSVRGMQPFQVIGRRLNSTKAEKCDKKYGTDFRLQLNIIPALPQLMVHFKDFPSMLLCGQVAAFVLEFTNCGKVPLQQLLAVTHTPEMITFGRPSFIPLQLSTNVYDSYNVHPGSAETTDTKSSKVFRLQFLPNMDSLLPDGRFWVPVWIQGPERVGTHNLDLLFYYETDNTMGPGCKSRHRILRSRSTFTTYEALSASAVAVTGAEPVGDALFRNITLAVELSNINQASNGQTLQLQLSQVSCISKRWGIEKMACQACRDVQIAPKENLNLCFRAVEKYSGLDREMDKFNYSNVVFQDREIESSECPCFDFYRKKIVQHAGASETGDGNGSYEETPLVAADGNNCLPTEKSDLDLTIIILWKAFNSDQSPIFYGQHQLTLTSVDHLVSTRTEPKVPEDKPPVRFFANTELSPQTAKSPSLQESLVPRHLRYFTFISKKIRHNFTKSRTCIVPVNLVLFNCAEFKVDVNIDTSATGNKSPTSVSMILNQSAASVQEARHFAWVGSTSLSMTMEPQQTKVVQLRACFFQHGTYGMNGMSIRAKPSFEDHQQHSIRVSGSTQLVIVEDTSRC